MELITNKYVANKKHGKPDQFLRGAYWMDCSGLVFKTQDPNFGVFLKDLRLNPSEFTVSIHDFRIEIETNEDGSIKEDEDVKIEIETNEDGSIKEDDDAKMEIETNEDGSIKEEIKDDGSRSTSYLVITEPLKFQREELCTLASVKPTILKEMVPNFLTEHRFQREELCTLASVKPTILPYLKLTKVMVPNFLTEHRFSSRFKKFIRKTMKLIEEKSRVNIYINVSPGSIFINADQKLKLFDLRSHFASIGESYKSLHSTIKHVLSKLSPPNGYINEINHFITSPSVPMSLYMCRHPSLLPPGQKLDMFWKLFDALKALQKSERWGTYYWIQKFENYKVLCKLLTHDGRVSYGDSYNDLLRAITNMIKHFNPTVVEVADKDGNHLSPLDNECHSPSYMYTDKGIEKIIDRLCPELASWSYEQVMNDQRINTQYFGTPKWEDL